MSLACLQDKHKRLGERTAAAASLPPESWTAVYRTHHAAVYARCRRLLRDRHAAEDATQETFARSLAQLSSMADAEHQRRWLLRVAGNHCLNQLRDRKRQAELLLEFTADPARDAVATVTARDVALHVTRGVSEETRRVAWLLYVQEMRQHQVAKELGISRRTVVNRLAAFRTAVRRAMAKLDRLPARPAA